MIEIQYNTPNSSDLDEKQLISAVKHTLKAKGESDLDITLRITTDDEMQELNRIYRDVDRPTDVLSFNQDVVDPETGDLYLGDIIISLEKARQQASEQGHSLNQECILLAIHGTLHLLGYDHAEPDEKAEMWGVQERLLSEVLASDHPEER